MRVDPAIRTVRALALCLLLGALLLGSAPGAFGADEVAALPVHDGVGGDFTLPSSQGREVGLAEFRGRVVLLFFGYTSCPDICPANLSHLNALMRDLGSDSDRTQVLLVTVDPETDTVEHLREYLARFDPRFIGLSGSTQQTEAVARQYRVKVTQSHGMEVTMEHNRSKAFADSGFLYAHSQQIYLIDKLGRTRGLYFTGSPVDEMKEAVLALLAE